MAETHKRRLYDEKCYELAQHFLADEPALNSHKNASDLAAEIQSAVEDWIGWEKRVQT